MNLATISYLPPRGQLNSEAFVANLAHWPGSLPLHLYSDDASWGPDIHHVANPEVVRNQKHWFSVNNLVFLFALKLAIDLKLDYFLYLESDARVRGEHWDQIIFDDCFRENRQPLLYGTPVIFNLSQSGPTPLLRGIDIAYRFIAMTGCPTAVHGSWPGAKFKFALFPNGALGIYHVPTLAQLFQGFEADIGRYAASITAWDCEIGQRFYQYFGDGIFDQFQFATRCYSGYGDELTTLDQRKALLYSGKISAVHQAKTNDPMTN
jgi:hypothetical protein